METIRKQSDFLPFCKLLEMKNTKQLYTPSSYTEQGIYTVFITEAEEFFTVLFDGENVIWLHIAHRASPSYLAFDRHRSFVQLMNEAVNKETSFPLTIKDFKEDDYVLKTHRAKI